MKLNNFFNKEPVPTPKRGREVFNVNNEYRETKLQTSIDDLTQEVDRLTVIDNEYRTLRGQHAILESQLSDARESIELLKDSQLRSNQDVLYYESKIKEIPPLEEAVRTLEVERDEIQDRFYKVDVVAKRNDEALTKMTGERNELSIENKSLGVIAHKAESETHELAEDFKAVKNQFDEYEKKFGDMSKIYIDTKRNNSVLKDERAYWENFACSLQEQLKENTELSTKLKQWLDTLGKDKNQANAQVTWGDTKITELETVIADMGKSLEDLLAEREYLNSLNDQLKYQLSKNSYASVGAIAKKEGFKMSIASSATNWNKNYLVNSRPTLLKFRAREE